MQHYDLHRCAWESYSCRVLQFPTYMGYLLTVCDSTELVPPILGDASVQGMSYQIMTFLRTCLVRQRLLKASQF